MSRDTRFSTMCCLRPASIELILACAYAQSDRTLRWSLEYSLNFKLLTEQDLEFLTLTGCCTGSSESIFVKKPHCWKSHITNVLRYVTWLPTWTYYSMHIVCVIEFRGQSSPFKTHTSNLPVANNKIQVYRVFHHTLGFLHTEFNDAN